MIHKTVQAIGLFECNTQTKAGMLLQLCNNLSYVEITARFPRAFTHTDRKKLTKDNSNLKMICDSQLYLVVCLQTMILMMSLVAS